MIGSKKAVMRKTYIGIAVAAAVALGGHEVLAQTVIPPATQDFAVSAGHSDAYEISAAQDALAQSQNASIQSFAKQMIDDHRRLSETLRQAASAAGLPPLPPGMSSDQAAMLSALQSARGADFDQAYARQQVLAHRQALAVEESYAQSGADESLRKAAKSAVPLIQHHLEMAERMLSAMGGS